jgi:uncharacterized repeat protein (TIGR01451 family)
MDESRRSHALLGGGLTVLLVALVASFAFATPAKATVGKQALVLDSSVSGGASSLEASRATADGFTVNVVDDTTWNSMTATDFAQYQLVIVGDPTCGSLSQVVSQNAKALSDAVMARAGGNTKAGNRILIGTDPVYHQSQGGAKLVNVAVDFAGVQTGATGLYLDFTCGDPDYNGNGIGDGQEMLLPLLSVDAAPVWTQDSSPPCGGDVSLISNAAQFSTLSSSDIRGWGCSVHESFPTFPTDWAALAIATDTTEKPTCGNDVDTGEARCGSAYLLIAGSGIVSTAPNLSLSPTTATNPVGTPHTVTASVTNPDGSPAPGVEVSFIVTGANVGAVGVCSPADCKSDSTGKVTFTYTGTTVGDDTINASITVGGSRQTATAAKTWTEAGPGGTDLSISKTGPHFFNLGWHAYWTITVTNNGSVAADGVTVTDNMPADLTGVHGNPSTGSCSTSGSTITCNLGSLAPGASATVFVAGATHSAGTITNTASVSSTTRDTDPSNNSASATSTVG